MSNPEMRRAPRDSLTLAARLKVDGQDAVYSVQVRNLSPRGLMAEGDVKVMRGSPVSVELPGAGWVEGSVAWKQDSRFGIAFVDAIETDAVRAG